MACDSEPAPTSRNVRKIRATRGASIIILGKVLVGLDPMKYAEHDLVGKRFDGYHIVRWTVVAVQERWTPRAPNVAEMTLAPETGVAEPKASPTALGAGAPLGWRVLS